MAKLPVEPSLFKLVDEYAAELAEEEFEPEEAIAQGAAVIAFCTNFYLQFFQNELRQEITTIDKDAMASAAEVRIGLRRRRGRAQIVQLIAWFEKLCEVFPELLHEHYTGSDATRIEFHTDYVLELLDRAHAWAKARNLSEIKRTVTSSRKALRLALSEAEWL